jgi:hypothetical protein
MKLSLGSEQLEGQRAITAGSTGVSTWPNLGRELRYGLNSPEPALRSPDPELIEVTGAGWLASPVIYVEVPWLTAASERAPVVFPISRSVWCSPGGRCNHVWV